MKYWIILASLLLGGGCEAPTQPAAKEQHGHVAEAGILYQCPMHPEVTRDHPGDCPICGMHLVPIEKSPVTAAAPGQARNIDRVAVQVPLERIQKLGVRSMAVQTTSAVRRTLRVVGTVEVDPNRMAHVHTRVSGWLERVQVRSEGDPVKRGEILYELYSPELVATQEEMLSAMRSGNRQAVDAARARLSYWDVADQDIQHILGTARAMRAVPFRSPMDGFVRSLQAIEGKHVSAHTDLYELTNLDKVWVIGSFYEAQVPFLEEGANATVLLPDGSHLEGRAEYIYPEVDSSTRFARARFVFDNHHLQLRPGMYVTLLYRADMGHGLIVPVDAVVRTGERSIAFVDQGQGRFVPRLLDLGPLSDDGYVVYDGLEDGETVASSAAFFLDSESALQAALAKFRGRTAASEHEH